MGDMADDIAMNYDEGDIFDMTHPKTAPERPERIELRGGYFLHPISKTSYYIGKGLSVVGRITKQEALKFAAAMAPQQAAPVRNAEVDPVLLNSISQWANDKLKAVTEPGPSMATTQLICIEFLRLLKLTQTQHVNIKDLIDQRNSVRVQNSD